MAGMFGLMRDIFEMPKRDFAWKVRWRMRFDKNPLLITLQDKYKMREYAESRGVKTAKLLFVTDRPETIPFSQMPETCFIKANHASGWNILRMNSEFYDFRHGNSLITPRGSLVEGEIAGAYKLTEQECVRTCQVWLGERYRENEWAYQFIVPKIVVEDVLVPRFGGELLDYRLYTFQGVVKAISIGSPSYRRNGENVFFDTKWNQFKLTKYKERIPDPLPQKPDNLQEMIAMAERIGKGWDFLRVDLYDTTTGIVLGEITIYPEGGMRDTPTACAVFNTWLGAQWRPRGKNALNVIVNEDKA